MATTNDKAARIFRKLIYFYVNKLPIHFKLETGEFRNGIILDLSEIKFTLVLKEKVMGTIPLLLEDIKESSIEEYKIEGKGNDMGY